MSQEQLLSKIDQLEFQLREQQHQRNIEKSPHELLKILIFEIIGTAIFAYGIVCSRGNDFLISAYLFAGIFLVCRFSGGHLNPAVSMSFYSSNQIDAFTLRTYWLGQLLGALLGALLAYLIVGQVNSPHIPNQPIEWIFADFCGETLGTFIFVLFIHIQVHKETQLTDNDLLGIGVIVTGLYFGRMLTFHTGGCLNPAMGVSLQIFQSIHDHEWDRLQNLWILIFGPILGGSLASEFYRNIFVFFLPQNQKNKNDV